ncbi:7799_t:CDS:1, partial [Gigaspora margarita]
FQKTSDNEEFIVSDSDNIIFDTNKKYNTEDYDLLEKEANNYLFGEWNLKNNNKKTKNNIVINKKEKENLKNNIVNDEFLYKFNKNKYENLGFLLKKKLILNTN